MAKLNDRCFCYFLLLMYGRHVVPPKGTNMAASTYKALYIWGRWKARDRDPRGVENTGSGGKHGFKWKTRFQSGKRGVPIFFGKISFFLTKMRRRNFVNLNCDEYQFGLKRVS